MKRIGVKRIKLSSIKAGGDVAKLRSDPLVKDIQDSLAATGGQPAEPIVVDKDNNIVAGRKRLAACLNAKVAMVDVMVFDGTADELEKICLVENVRRKHLVGAELDEEISKLVTLEMATVPHENPDKEYNGEDEPEEQEEPKRGRPKTEATKAREVVASKLGTTPEAVRSHEKRAKQATAPKEPAKAPPADDNAIETLGMVAPYHLTKLTNEENALLANLYADLIEMSKRVTRISKATGRTYTALADAIHNAGAVCKRESPSHICVWCKCHSKLQKSCLGCQGKGYLTVGEMEAIHDKKLREQLLRTGEDAGVYAGGQFVPLKEV